MKTKIVFLVLFFLQWNLFSQINHFVKVNPGAETFPALEALKPGLFYFQFWNQSVNAIYNYVSHEKMYNSLQQNKFESECWKWSLSFNEVLQ